ncbi:MAG: hypothetical protein E7618_01975 [Ruminococcaceae bacterium]|nr:hypothetical protein [Oscillospiraceae bacterium]
MKKLLIALLSLTLMVGMLALNAFAAVPTQPAAPAIEGEAVVLLNGSTNTTLKGVDNEFNQSIAAVDSGDKKIIEITYTDVNNAGMRVDLDGVVNATDKAYFEFWVDASALANAEAGKIGLGLRLFALDGSAADVYKCDVNNVAHYYYQDGNAWVEGLMGADWGQMSLPNNYKGYIRVNLAEFASHVPDFCGNGKTLKLSQVCGLAFWSTVTNVNGTSFYCNDFRFVNASLEAPGTQAPTTQAPSTDVTPVPPAGSDLVSIAILGGAVALTATAIVISKKRK